MNAYFALLRVELFFPESGSLKAKRAHLNRVKAWLRERHGAAVSEVDHQDTWQRATLAVALTAGNAARCLDAADDVGRTLSQWDPAIERRILSWADTEAIG